MESHYEDDLGLTGKVAIVISAASPTGTAICRELLNNKIFVLGLDVASRQREELFKGESSFKLVEYEASGVPSGVEVAQAAMSLSKSNRIDWLINIIDDTRNPGESPHPTRQILAIMEERRNGLLLNVVGESINKGAPQEIMLIEQTDETFTRLKEVGVRCNLLVPHDLNADDDNDEDSWLYFQTRAAVQMHIQKQKNSREQHGNFTEVERRLASVAVFLCSDMGEHINGAIVDTKGNCVAL